MSERSDDRIGVLVVHGFTGSPQTMGYQADALAKAGFTVSLPRLPGHGTVVEDMMDTRFADWSGAADVAYRDLAERVDAVVVVGLSMGGTLTCWLAARHPEVGGIVCVNPAVKPDPDARAFIASMIDAGETMGPGVGSDLADPDAHEEAYEGVPLAAALSLFEAIEDLQADLPRIACPLLLMTSPQDHVVPPQSSDHLAATVSGPVERVALERSYHVATLDHDKDLIAERTIAFVRKVAGGKG